MFVLIKPVLGNAKFKLKLQLRAELALKISKYPITLPGISRDAVTRVDGRKKAKSRTLNCTYCV